MGLHDRLKTSNGSSSTSATTELLSGAQTRETSSDSTAQDPYAELKTRIHHACIATLGAELFKREATGDLNERVTRAVTEQLVLDRTPLTREEGARTTAGTPAASPAKGPSGPSVRNAPVREGWVKGPAR